MPQKTTSKPIEEQLWESANKLPGKVESLEYKHDVLGLIFLKFASDKFEVRRQELIEEDKEKYLEMKQLHNVLVPSCFHRGSIEFNSYL